MKKLNILLGFLTLSLGVSCNTDEFLAEENPNTITTDIFWETEDQFQTALTTVYGALQFQSISGGELIYEMIMGDIAGTESWYRPFAFRNFTFNDGTYYVTDKWNELYIGIFRANQVIQNIQDEENIFEDGEKARIEAQARFLRAFFYFELVHTYGGGIIQTEVAEAKEDFAKPFSSIEEITSQVIIPDLEFARTNLPKQWSGNNIGRATWGASTSLLAKVYLYGEDWDTSVSLFKEVIDSGIYSLTADIMDNFTDENEFNSESIFEVTYSSELSPGVGGAVVDDNPNETGAEASTLATAFGQLNFGGFNTLLPTYYLHELYVNDEVDPANPVNDGNEFSTRMNASIVPVNGEGLYYQLPIGERAGWAFGQSAYIKKYTNWYHWEGEGSNSRSGINFRHIRLADIYLMYAEAVLQSSGNVDEAIEYVDLVRKRAGVVTLQQYLNENSGTFPQLHISEQVHGTQPMALPTVDNVLTHIRRVERPLELAFEGHRWKDLVRWDIVQEVFDDLRQDEIWRQEHLEELQISSGGIPPLFIQERIRPDFNLAAPNYTPSQHNYLPIPSQEVQTNDQL
ncbi:Starch-binding associating with outer membrane [Salegentibacter agarivorans]|uniref:Starch-binding associating with outer membrane n=1 Tax=Salegentibacter agarivorans TaxID=345907 RepID=A0A1I2KT74_9FLAO|nr:RagB/SusD family nutrient uptake outer membrane protein [Salegentibacter agarivorans]SFF68291.1 Starch-binding associating with outer membrane [Salegentibacter agarivorans]